MKAIIFDWSRTLYNKETKKLYPGVLELLGELKSSYKLGLVSRKKNGNFAKREARIRSFGVWKYFGYTCITKRKNQQRFRDGCEQLGVKPEEVLVVGDHMERDIGFANAIGCKTCLVLQGLFDGTGYEYKPTYIVKEVQDVRTILSS